MDKLTAHLHDAVTGKRARQEAAQRQRQAEVQAIKAEIQEIKQKLREDERRSSD